MTNREAINQLAALVRDLAGACIPVIGVKAAREFETKANTIVEGTFAFPLDDEDDD